MHSILVALHVIVALFLVLVVLLQTGKGAAMGSAFGGAGSQALFGSSSAGNFLTKLTTAAAAIFMITSLSLTTISADRATESVIQDSEQTLPSSDSALPGLPEESSSPESPLASEQTPDDPPSSAATTNPLEGGDSSNP
ncbi:MAG: preprotein translocase subunit SecG [Nitrospinota bacterium]|nr:preprotein translocase subunit SecG [Nitrospinota bacterium]